MTSLLALLSVFLSSTGSAPGQAAGTFGQALIATRQLSYNRQLEQEADSLGVKYMAEAGFDPKAALGFFKILEQERVLNPVDVPPYLMSHPLSRGRVAGVEASIRSLRLESPRRRQADTMKIKKIKALIRIERQEADAVASENERLLEREPENGEALYLLAVAQGYKGRWSEARRNYERARALDSKIPDIDRDLGRVYTQLGEFPLAHQAFERSLAAEPGDALNYFYMGELFEKEENLSAAAGAYLRAHQLSTLWPDAAQRLGAVYGRMNRLGDAYYYLGRYHLLRDEDDRAAANFERALKALAPGSPRALVMKEELEALRARRR